MLHVANQVIENVIENIDCESSFQLRLFQYHQNAEHHSGQNTVNRQFYGKVQAASLPGLVIPVAVAVLGWSLFHDKYVWSPSLLR